MTQESIAVSTTPPLPGVQLVDQVNKAFQTVASDFAGSADPAALAGPYMTWADTASGMQKRRNAAGTAWITIGPLFSPGRFYEQGEEPTEDVGDIWVNGVGPCRWDIGDGRYYSLAGTRRDRILLTTSGSWTPDAYTKWVWRRMVGGGGGGAYGGSAGTGGSGAGGGGGDCGGYRDWELVEVTPGVAMSYTIGAGGTQGTSSTNATDGGATTFGGVTVQGGTGGGRAGAEFPGTANLSGHSGGPGSTSGGPPGSGGNGGPSPWGPGGAGGARSGSSGSIGLVGKPPPTTAYGAGGGGGGGSYLSANFAGGSVGCGGCIEIWI